MYVCVCFSEVEEILRGNHMISIASVQRKAETIMKQVSISRCFLPSNPYAWASNIESIFESLHTYMRFHLRLCMYIEQSFIGPQELQRSHHIERVRHRQQEVPEYSPASGGLCARGRCGESLTEMTN